MKKLLNVHRSPHAHWVGDGFPVRSIFTYQDLAPQISPFLLMDYAAPTNFPPSTGKHVRGVGEHPHRGFETVTIVYSGEVEHRDSAGGGGTIGPGDVQWMTAASGLVHEERHGANFARTGGAFEMVQLWVNLPARDKAAAPRYQGLRDGATPRVPVDLGEGYVRVIAGEFRGARGPARTFTPVDLWDVRLQDGARASLSLPPGHTALVFVLDGEVRLHDGEVLRAAELGILDRAETDFTLTAVGGAAKVLVLGGEPLNEPIVGHGPFVMNTRAEIQQAFVDFQSGKMGQIGRITGSD